MPGLEAERLRAALKAKLFNEPARPLLVGRFEVLAKIAEGGMGVVYRARDPALDRVVALKLLHAGGESEQLLAEARAMARLDHPNVVSVFEVGTSGDRVFLAMEYVDGATLDGWLGAAPRSHGEIAAAFASAARGLGAAHRAHLVHRDFKPQNVLVANTGELRVADFGLARGAMRADGAPLTASGPLSRTRLAGTPLYMAPELLAGASPSPKTDQFSFAVALFEAIHRRKPFEGKTLDELRAAHARGPAAMTGGVPRRTRDAAMRGLSVDPDARFPSMEQFADALSAPPKRRWIPAAITGAVGLCVAIPMVYFVTERGARRPVAPAPVVSRRDPPESTAVRATSATPPDAPTPAAALPPPPDVDWSKRSVPDYTLEGFKGRLRDGGFEVVRAQDASSPHYGAIFYLTVKRPPCAGGANYFAYKTVSLAEQSEKAMVAYGGARVVRTGGRVIQLALSRTDSPAGDPACADPAALLLTE